MRSPGRFLDWADVVKDCHQHPVTTANLHKQTSPLAPRLPPNHHPSTWLAEPPKTFHRCHFQPSLPLCATLAVARLQEHGSA